MADHGSCSGTSSLSRAINLLREATTLIANESTVLGSSSPTTLRSTFSATNVGSIRNTTLITAGTNSVTTSALAPLTPHRNTTVLGNFQNLFGRSHDGSHSFHSRQQSSRPSASKKAKKTKGFFQVKETWTHEFHCLANCNQSQAPSRKEKIDLQNAGLGRKKIVFSSNCDAFALKDKLYEVYPKLKEGGGFELLRSGSTANELVRIKPPMAGYSVPFLRDVSGLSQALAYIRPLQKKLSMEVVEEPEVQVLRNYLPF